MTGPVFILVMMLIFFLLGFVVPSSSGLAVLSMPILGARWPTPWASSARWWCAPTSGDQYAMLYLAPTGLVLATLTMLDMKFTPSGLKFVWPMVLFVLIFGGILLVAQVLVYGAA